MTTKPQQQQIPAEDAHLWDAILERIESIQEANQQILAALERMIKKAENQK